MKRCESFEEIVRWLMPRIPVADAGGTASLVLIGGCSRVGKSTLARRIAASIASSGVSCTVVSLDAWILGVDQRRPGSLVTERYECARMTRDILAVLGGGTVHPPEYDPESRRRISERGTRALSAPGGVLIAEGVVALSLEVLRERAAARIIIDIDEAERIRRVETFYLRVKGLPPGEVEEIVRRRETEEVPFVKSTGRFADVLYCPRPLEAA